MSTNQPSLFDQMHKEKPSKVLEIIEPAPKPKTKRFNAKETMPWAADENPMEINTAEDPKKDEPKPELGLLQSIKPGP